MAEADVHSILALGGLIDIGSWQCHSVFKERFCMFLKNGIVSQMSASAILINECRINFLHSSGESYDQFQNVKITQPI